MSLYLWIALGSGLGGVARFALSGVVAHRFGGTFPWVTLEEVRVVHYRQANGANPLEGGAS